MATDVVVIFALNREAAPFRKLAKRDRLPVRVVVAGMGPDAARRAAEGLSNAGLVISAGFCGALNPALRVGDIIVADALLSPSPLAGEGWGGGGVGVTGRDGLTSSDQLTPHPNPPPQGGRGQDGRLLTVPHLVATPHEKRQLRDRTSADIVDMEAAAVAAVCAARDVPFLAVKAVSDTADTALSPRLANLLAGGRVSPLKAVAALALQPSLAWEFRHLARDTAFAAKQLAAALRTLVRSRLPTEALA